LFLTVGMVLILALIVITRPEPQAQRSELPPVQVQVAPVQLGDLQPSVRVGGYLQPVQQARLQFQVGGRLQQRLVEPGTPVAQGEALLRLEPADYQDLLTEARAQLDMERAAVARDRQLLQLAERNRELQQAEVARQQRLGTESLSSKAALDAARQRLLQLQAEEAQLRYNVDSATARLDRLEAAARRAKRNLERTTLRAPFAGTVNQVLVQVGDEVAANEVVLELLDANRLEFYAEIERALVTELERGQRIEVLLDGQTYAAQIVALQQHPDPDTYTYALRARFDNPGLVSGAAAEARLLLPELKQVTLVPVSALVHDDGQVYVFVVKDGVLQRRPVKLGARQGERQVIVAGVAAGERVVSRGGGSLSDGLKVQF
jgi:multidrug efflux pump subunit AcrA (membrane-fusion protein)